MKIKLIGACMIVFLLAVLLLSNTVSAGGPPIGVQEVEISPSGTVYPGEAVTVTIMWWITDPDYLDETGTGYYGPFDLKIGLESNDLTEEDEVNWEEHVEGISFDDQATESHPYKYTHTRGAPRAGSYTVEVQITATGLAKEVGHGNYLLVASAEEPLTSVPEFTTIAIPVAAILGLLFFFNRRKRRKEVIKE